MALASITLRTALLALVAGCAVPLSPGASRPPRIDDLVIIDAVIAAGVARGIESSACREERERRIAVVEATDATMRHLVGYCASGGPTCAETATIADATARRDERARRGCLLGTCAGGSVVWPQDDVWPLSLGRWRAEILVSSYETPGRRRDLLRHEAVHWLLGCSMGTPDGGHSRAIAWGPDGIEQAARRALAVE